MFIFFGAHFCGGLVKVRRSLYNQVGGGGGEEM